MLCTLCNTLDERRKVLLSCMHAFNKLKSIDILSFSVSIRPLLEK